MDKRLIFMPLMVIVALTALTISGCGGNPDEKISPPQEIVGTWLGTGLHNLSSEYLDQKEIPVKLDIASNGDITGFIGDAQFSKTHVQQTVWYLRLIGKPTYFAELSLGGDIVRRESFSRKGGTLLFDKYTADEMTCEFVSTGSRISMKDMQLHIKGITLNHPNY